MSISHWGITPGILWCRDGAFKWRSLSFDFYCLSIPK